MPNDLIRFTPTAGDSPSEPPPVYLIRKPGIFDRINWEYDVTRAGARGVGDEELRACLHEAIEAVLEDDEREAARADVELVTSTTDRLTNRKEGEEPSIPEGFAAALTRVTKLEDRAIREFPPYARARAAREFWWIMSRYLAARHFLAGKLDAEGKEVFFQRKHREMPLDESILEGLPRAHVFEIGLSAISAMRNGR